MRDISLHLLDIVQNSIAASAQTISVFIAVEKEKGLLLLTIQDDGCGMDEELLKNVVDPFTTTRKTRRTGMGIPLLKASAERAGGRFRIQSAVGKGTVLEAGFQILNIDRLPLGDIGNTYTSLIICSPGIDFRLTLGSPRGNFKVSTAEIKQKLGDVAITEFNIITWIREYVNEGVSSIFGGVLNEIDSRT